MLNEDYRDILLALSAEKAKFLVVGAYAMAFHGYPRTTMEIDIWVEPSSGNAEAVLRALARFGAPLFDLTIDDLKREGTVFQIGFEPQRIDMMTAISGVTFEEAYAQAMLRTIDGIDLPVLSIDHLIRNKLASARKKDLADVEALESLKDKLERASKTSAKV